MSAKNDIAGSWNFETGVTREGLIEVAESWVSAADGYRYRRISVRQCSPGKYVIDFCYALEDESQESFVLRVSGSLRQQFGSARVGWKIGLVEWEHVDHWGSLANELRDYTARVIDTRLTEDHEVRYFVTEAIGAERIGRRGGRIPKVE